MMKNFTYAVFIFCSCLFFSVSLRAQNAYITNQIDSSVSVIDTKTNLLIKTIRTPYLNPNAVVVSPDGSRAFITYFGNDNNNISVINTATNTIINNIIFANGGSGGDGIDISPDGSKLYYASTGTEGIPDTVFVINSTSGSVIAGIPFSTQGGIRGIVVSPDGSKVYVADNSDIIVIDATTNTILTTINTTGSYLYGIAISPNGSTVYATAYFSEQIFVINTSTNTISGSISTGGGSFPLALVVSPDGSRVYVSNVAINNVIVINTATNTIVDTVSTALGPNGLSLTPDGSLLYVADQGSNQVSVINTTSNSVVATVPVGQGPIAFGKFIASALPTSIPPTITSFSPSAGPVGTGVTITGTNFNAAPANNIVFFGAVRATVTSATTTSLTVTVPAGVTYQPISVLNGATGLTAYSSRPFITTFTNPFGTGIPANFYKPKVDFATGTAPTCIAFGDMDGDGKPDLVVSNGSSATISVFRNISDSGNINASSFATKVDFATGFSPRSFAISDVDGDGKPDLVVTYQPPIGIISVLRNTSSLGTITSSSFAAKVDFSLPGANYAIAIGDLDGDGKPDLAVPNNNAHTISIFHNTSTLGTISASSFAPGVEFATGGSPLSVAIGDVDGDGKSDLVVSNTSPGTVSVLHNISTSGSIDTSSFAAKVDFALPASGYSLAIGDVDGDGKSDLVVGIGDSISVLRNTSNLGSITSSSFATRVDFAAPGSGSSMAIGDVDGDGKPDVVVDGSTSIHVLRNISTSGTINSSSFASTVEFNTGVSAIFSIAIGDIDGDGIPEVGTANIALNTVSVFQINHPTIPVNPTKLGIKSFSIFAGDSTASLTDSLRYGVEIGSWSGSAITGNIGSNTFIRFTNPNNLTGGSFIIQGDVYGNTVSSTGIPTISGSVSVLNKNSATYNVLNMTSGSIVNPGNVFVNGNAFTNSAPAGVVQIPANYTYTGPIPGGGLDITTPVFPQMPDLPPVSDYGVPTSPDITNTRTIVPGFYGNIILNGGDSITFSGVGTYVFAGANITNANNFIYDFKNNTTGGIQIIFTQDADLGNLQASTRNGGSASRIFTEAKGRGNEGNNFTAFAINTTGGAGASWVGTVYAPYAAIAGGNVDPQSVTLITGCLWSKTKITLGPDIGLTYAPPAVVSEILPVTDIIPYYPAPADGKINTVIGSELTSLFEHQGTITTDSIIFRIFGNQVLIDVVAQPNQYSSTLNFLVASGLTDTVTNGPGSRIITGKFPIANLLLLNTRADIIKYARPLYFPLNNAGIVQSQGDTALQTTFVRKAYGLSGSGVKVGVLSDSYNSIPGDYAGIDISNGDLPGPGNPYNHLNPVQNLGEYPYGQSIDEGRAMLEIVHDIAPGASLAFRTGFTTPGDFAVGIGQLQAAGCKVIVDDITFITEPYFRDGVVAHAVDNAVAAGSTYFSAAGNFGLKSYEGDFSGITAPASLGGMTVPVHDFGSGNPLQTLNLKPGNYTIVLQWDDNIYSMGAPSTGASTDLDIYLVDNFGNMLFGFNRDNSGSDPIEVLPFTVMDSTTANLLIAKATGPDVHFKYIVFRGDLTINGYAGASTLVGQANSAGAIAVGAAFYRNTPPPPYNVNPPTISSFSSVGGTIVEGSVRNKPDIVAPQGINTTVEFGAVDYEPDNFPNFFGTSAAAPHAAASAALIIEGQQKFISHTITPAETRTLLESTALDMNTPGFDAVTGYGFIQPMAAMQTFAAPKPIIIALQTSAPVVRPVSTAFTVIVKGKFLTPRTVVYLRGVAIATNFLNTDSVSAVIPPFTDNPAVQLYNPPITSGLLDGGFSDSLYFFPKKLITIKANNQTKKYGEALPGFTSAITVDGVPLANTSLTPDDLKLNPILYTSSANASSNIATYYIHPYNVLDPLNPADSLLLATYTYEFIDGLLTVTKLPIKISPRDTTLVYGQQIRGIGFNYVIDSLARIGNKDSLIKTIRFSHTSAIIDSVYVLASKNGSTSRPLVNSDLDGLGILMSTRSGATSRPLVNNGSGTTEISYVVDIDNQSIFNYQVDPYSSPLVNSNGAKSRALVNTGPLINGMASVVVNGSGAKSRPLVNGNPLLLNSATTGKDSISNIAVIVSSDDVPDATTNRIFTEPVNLVTGITVGQNIIAPAAFISANFDITYGLGNLTITPAPLLVTANAASTSNGQLPPFSATIQGFQYQDSGSSPRQGPQFTVLPAYTGDPGTYAIQPSGLMFPADTNYIKTYIDGVLTVFPYQADLKPIVLKLKCVEELCRSRSGYKYVAHFYYENRNSTSVTIPVGINNKITSYGPYKGNQPSVFNPGINYVDYYFNGEKLTWRIVTPNTGKDNYSEATASLRSPKCNDDDMGTKDAIASENPKDSRNFWFYRLYPNPAHNTVWLFGSNFNDDQKHITIISATGVEYQPRIKSQTGQVIEIDISDLPKGVYFMRIEDGCHIKILPFIKL